MPGSREVGLQESEPPAPPVGGDGEGQAGLAADRRAQILYAAAKVISERGADRARLMDVARTAGVSIGMIQHYFTARDELLAGAFEFCTELWMRDWEAAAAREPDPRQRLLALLRMSAYETEGWREVQWRIWIEFWSLCDRDPAFQAQYAGIYEKFRSPFYESIRQGIAAGQFTPSASVEDIVDRLTAQIEGLRVRALIEAERMPRERLFELLVRSAELELQTTLALSAGDGAAGTVPRGGRAVHD